MTTRWSGKKNRDACCKDKVMDNERKQTIANLVVIIALMALGSFIGKLVIDNVADTWIALNGPILGIFGIGELDLVEG